MTEPHPNDKWTDDQIVARYLEVREFIRAEAAAQAAFMKPHNDTLQVLGGELHRRLLARNPNWQAGEKASGSTADGTFFLKTSSSIKVSDRQQFFDFIVSVPPDTSLNDALWEIRERIGAFMTASVVKEAVEEYIELHKDAADPLPPGVTLERITECQVRKT